MLQAVLFTIRSVGQALMIYLSIPIQFTDNISVRMYDVFVFLFVLDMFWKFLGIVLTRSVSSEGGRH